MISSKIIHNMSIIHCRKEIFYCLLITSMIQQGTSQSTDNLNSLRISAQVQNQTILFVFFIVGCITLFPLLLLAIVVTLRSNSRFVKFVLVSICIILSFVILIFVVLRFPFRSLHFNLMKGDQIMHRTKYSSAFCESVTIETNRTGLRAFGVLLAPRQASKSYGLTVNNHVFPGRPLSWTLRLANGDTLTMEGIEAKRSLNYAIFKGQGSSSRWLTEPSQLTYEQCCNWKEGLLEAEGEKATLKFTADRETTYRLVIRPVPTPEEKNNEALEDNKTKINLKTVFKMKRTVYMPSDCDPIYCSGKSGICHLETFTSRFILDFHVADKTEPPVEYMAVLMHCNPRQWVYGLLFGLIPLALIVLSGLLLFNTEVCVPRRKRNQKKKERINDDCNNDLYEVEL